MPNPKITPRHAANKLRMAEAKAKAIIHEAEAKAEATLKAAQEEAEAQQHTSASGILEEAAAIVAGSRNTTHGEKERSFQAIADFWNVYLANRKDNPVYAGVTAENVTQMFELAKVVRSIQGTPVRDHFVDAAGYAGITGELYEARAARGAFFGSAMKAAHLGDTDSGR